MTIYLRGPTEDDYGRRAISAPGDLHNSEYKNTGVRFFCDRPGTCWENPDVDKVVKAHVDATIETRCIKFLEWLWGGGKGGAPKACKKLKLSQVQREKISWGSLCDFGLRAVKFHFHESAEAGRWDEQREHEREQKNAHITIDDVLREIEKHLTKLIKKDFVKVTEKDLCAMAHMHEHAVVKDKDPAMQRVLTGAANLVHSNYARACGGKWGYVSARWQQSEAPGEVLRLQFERFNGKIVELTAEEMHFHWRAGRGHDLGLHPVLALTDAWLERNQSA